MHFRVARRKEGRDPVFVTKEQTEQNACTSMAATNANGCGSPSQRVGLFTSVSTSLGFQNARVPGWVGTMLYHRMFRLEVYLVLAFVADRSRLLRRVDCLGRTRENTTQLSLVLF